MLDLSLVQGSTKSFFCKFSFKLTISSWVHASLDVCITVLFSCAKKYLHVPSSMFFGTNPKTRLALAAHFSWLNTQSNSLVQLRKEMLRDDMVKLNTQCPPFSSSESTRKWLQELSSPFSSLSSIYYRRVSISRLDVFIGVACWLLLCFHSA